ncbi:MAG: divergent polysaccharide deacetylase family protein [Campylobacterota bacterium]|nr:divergent polysaccharide deacetylase family protein [Campylobacterota bacterium]
MKKRSTKKPPKKILSKKKSINKTMKIIVTLAVILLIVISFFSFLFLNKDVDNVKINNTEITKENIPTITYEEKTKALEIEYAKDIDNSIYVEKQIKKPEPKFHFEEPNYGKIDDSDTYKHIEPIEVIPKKEFKKEEHKIENNDKLIVPYKPKLAIIIDDVTTNKQIKNIKDIGYIVNIAILPPTKNHKNSAKISKNLDKHMVHLPLQASSSKYEEEDTLYITDTIVRIENKIKELKLLYPKATYINNHTGSKFTSNKEAMDKLMQVLKKYNYTFVDSRTTAKSVAGLSAKKYGVRMLSRNIFLDNNKNKKYIQNQLKKAIKNAKKYGSAIAIGHPYSITFQTLKESKYLLKDIDLVYIDKL